jgi:hypothetical protein
MKTQTGYFTGEKDHTKCLYFMSLNTCIRCKHFYLNKDEKLEDLYEEK